MAGDQNNVGMGFRDTCSNGSNTDFRHQLHVHTGPRVRVLQIVDQLREVLDGVDVVVRRRGDQPDARSGVSGLGNPRIDLVSGQLPAFTRLRSLRHLDLDVVAVDEVFTGDTEAPRGNLLDGGTL